MGPVNFAVEAYSEIREEAAPLTMAHWQESEAEMFGPQGGVPMATAVFESLEQGGLLHVVTVRQAEVLQGYAVYCLSENLNMPGRITASALGLYLSGSIRRADPFLALRLLRWADGSLRARGVFGVSYSSPASRPCDVLYRRLGATLTETIWFKEL